MTTTATANPSAKKKGLYVPEPQANPLQTQRDGRLFAIDALEACESHDGDDSCVNPIAPPWGYGVGATWEPYRKAPQWDGLAWFFFRVFREGTEDAQKGFIAILTDLLADDGVHRDAKALLEDERHGLNQDFGEPGSAAPFPKGVDNNGKVMKGHDYKAWSAKLDRKLSKGR